MIVARKSYRDVLARSERLRPDGTTVWPIGFHDRPRAAAARSAETAEQARGEARQSVPSGRANPSLIGATS